MTNFMNSEKREKLIIHYGKLCKAKPLTGCIYKKKWDCAVFFFSGRVGGALQSEAE